MRILILSSSLFLCILSAEKRLDRRCGASFEVEVVSEKFEGKRLLERHRMVNAALVELMQSIHALSIKKALAPSQLPPPAEPAAA